MANGYTITIGLVDNVTKHLAAINKQIAAAQAPFNRLSKQISKFAELSGINALINSFKSLGRTVLSVLGTLAKMVPALATLTGAATLLGLSKMIYGWADFGTKLRNTADIIGTSVSKLQSLQNAGRLAGMSADSMAQSIDGLGRVAQEALSGHNNEAAAFFQAWGISFQKSGLQAKSGAEMIYDAYDVIKKMKEQGKSAAVIEHATTSYLGMSRDVIPVAEREGSAGLRRLEAEAQHFGVMSKAGADQAYKLYQSYNRVKLSVEGFANAISEKLGPVLSPLLDQLAEWINDNKQFIDQYVNQFAQWIATVDFKSMIADIRNIISFIVSWMQAINRAVQAMGGWVVVTKTLFYLWAAGKLIAIANNIITIVTAIRAAITATTALNVANQALNRTMAANPLLRTAMVVGSIFGAYEEMKKMPESQEEYDSKQDAIPKDSPLYVPPSQRGTGGSSSGGKARKTKPLPPDVEDEIRKQSQLKGLDPDWMVALARTEGGPGRSPAGATGYMQLMPGTAGDLKVDPNDRHQNIEGGLRYFKQMLDLFNGDYAAASAAYNAGPHNAGVKKYAATGDPSSLPSESKNYVATIQSQVSPGSADVASVMQRLRQSIAKPDNDNQVASQNGSATQVGGHLQVTINAPAGYPTSAKVSGNAVKGAPRVVTPVAPYSFG